jgi:hypothetical protein
MGKASICREIRKQLGVVVNINCGGTYAQLY